MLLSHSESENDAYDLENLKLRPKSGGFASDKYKFVFWCWMILGVGALFPFNAYITAM